MNDYTLLAKSAVENYLKEGKVISPQDDLSEDILNRRLGVFITILKEENLRACIGTYLPTRPTLAEEIINNSISAATKDYRFGPITKEELDSLSYIVYVLSEPEPVENLKEMDSKKFGIIVKTSPFVFPGKPNNQSEEVTFDGHTPFKSGILLPDLPNINSPEEQFKIACQKGGINPEKEKVFIYRFTVEKYNS